MMVTGSTPALLALQANVKKPYFDGDERKWVQFTRDWGKYVVYAMIGAPEGAVGGVWKRNRLVGCLHGVLGRRHTAQAKQRPSLSFQKVWRDLECNYALDDPHHWRAQWEKVELHHQGESIRLRDWLFFQSEFEVAKGMVADWTEQEELDLLVKKLPMGWRTRVLRQEAKESKHKFAVKVLNSPVGGERLRMVLGGLGVQVVDVRGLAGCSVTHLRAEAHLNMLLEKTDIIVGGRKLSMQVVRGKWSASRIFQFVANELKIEKASQILGETPGQKKMVGEPPRGLSL